jgi:deoxyribonuclease (pyrimidine dimer)
MFSALAICLFFGDKLTYLNDRHAELVKECLRLGKRITMTDRLCWAHIGIPKEYWGDWAPDQEAMALNRERINERLEQMKRKN